MMSSLGKFPRTDIPGIYWQKKKKGIFMRVRCKTSFDVNLPNNLPHCQGKNNELNWQLMGLKRYLMRLLQISSSPEEVIIAGKRRPTLNPVFLSNSGIRLTLLSCPGFLFLLSC